MDAAFLPLHTAQGVMKLETIGMLLLLVLAAAVIADILLRHR